MPRHTHTYVTLEVSHAAYREIRDKLMDAGYDHCLMKDGELDMAGIAITGEAEDTD